MRSMHFRFAGKQNVTGGYGDLDWEVHSLEVVHLVQTAYNLSISTEITCSSTV